MLSWLVPANVGRLKIYSEKILVINVNFWSISAALITQKSNKIIVENFYHQKFQAQETSLKKVFPDKEKLKEYLVEAFKYIGSYSQLWYIVPASFAIFKELTLPFSDYEKIKKSLPFEIEPHLIFPLEEVSLDFIILSVDKDDRAKILTSVIRNSDLQKLTSATISLDRQATKLTLDGLVLLELTKVVPEYSSSMYASAVLEISEHQTLITFMEYSNFKGMHLSDFGAEELIYEVGKSLELENSQVVEMLRNSGIAEEGSENPGKAYQAFTRVFSDIKFALENFALNSVTSGTFDRVILFISPEYEIKNIADLLSSYFGIRVEKFSYEAFLENTSISFRKNELTQFLPFFIKPIGAIVAPSLQNFNLGNKLFSKNDFSIVSKQIILSFLLLIGMFSFIFLKGFRHINTLEKLAASKEEVLMKELKQIVPPATLTNKRATLKILMESATEFIKTKINVQNVATYNAKVVPDVLVILLEITRLFDRTRFGTEIKSFVVKQDPADYLFKIYLEGSFDKSKSLSGADDFNSFIRVVTLSRRFSMLEPVKQTGDNNDKVIGFSLVLGINQNENNK